ncbi:uracil-DNA glycosylase family protein [Muribaculaceae bacterium Isolate-002 (NCI)]|nr:uracil-DNA glycosylase family protein [Muribaculaceae bacterium Isolate-002 (NCI)]
MNNNTITTERHPWPPFIPKGARILIMGTFPPGQHRWSMPFFYPNPINDFWRVMGIIYFNDKDSLYLPHLKTFDLEKIKKLLETRHIAMGDTGLEVVRLKGNASDKYLDIIKPIPLAETLEQMPECIAVATTGEKAARVVAEITNTEVPGTGSFIEAEIAGRNLKIYRMPSTSRAYPMPLTKKAEIYRSMLSGLNLCD